jgi:phosphonate transport system substrate-binding protein
VNFYTWVSVLVVGVLAGVGCTTHQPRAEHSAVAGSPSACWPTRLRIGISPGSENAEERVKSYAPYAAYLSRELGIPVTLVKTSGYNMIIEAMRADKLDMGTMGPFSYLIATTKVKLEPLVCPGTDRNTPRQYYTYIIASKPSGISSMQQLREQASQLVLQFTDPASTSGHLIPRTYLDSIGLQPERSFKQVLFGMNHTATIMSLVSGKVDVAAVYSTGYEKMVRKGMFKREEAPILWKSEAIISAPTVIRSNFCQSFRDSVRTIMLSMKQRDTAAWKAVSSSWTDTSLIYVSATDSLYTRLRSMASSLHLLADASSNQ